MAKQIETEERILIAATETFIRKGKDGARMQDIADRAKINKALLHYYFRSKEQLYYIVFEKIFTGFLRSFAPSIPFEKDFKTALEAFIDKYIDAIVKHRQIFRFFVWEIHEGGDKLSHIIPKVFSNLGFASNPFIDFIEKAIKTKQIKPIDSAQLFLSILSLCVFPIVAKPIVEKVVPGFDIPITQFAEERKKIVFNLIWNGIQLENERS